MILMMPVAVYAEMREGLLAEDTEFASKTVTQHLKGEDFLRRSLQL